MQIRPSGYVDAFSRPNRSQPPLSTRPTLCSYRLCAVITRTAQQISFSAFWDKTEPRLSNEFWLLVFSSKHPATYTLSCRLGAAPKPNVAGVPTGRSLAHGPPAAAGIAAYPGDNLVLPPALRSSTCRLPPRGHTRTPQVTRLPQSGCSRRVFNTASTRSHNAAEQRFPKRQVLTTINPGEYNYHIPN